MDLVITYREFLVGAGLVSMAHDEEHHEDGQGSDVGADDLLVKAAERGLDRLEPGVFCERFGDGLQAGRDVIAGVDLSMAVPVVIGHQP